LSITQQIQVMLKSLAFLSLIPFSICILVTPPTPPRGYNTFDTFPSDLQLNETLVFELAKIQRDQLLPFGYDTFVIDGGWSTCAKKLPNGTSVVVQTLDEFGRQLPCPERYPNGMKALAEKIHSLGLKFGLWTIRGIHEDSVSKNLKVKGMNTFLRDLVDVQPVGGGKNGSCLWAHEWHGVNMSLPGSQEYYNSRVELFSSWDVDFIKADCMMCAPCYTDEIVAFSKAVKDDPSELVLSYSPGGGNSPYDGKWVADNKLAAMYRIVTDFHGGWYGWGGLQQNIFTAGNFSALKLFGANNTYADLDLIPLNKNWWNQGQEMSERGQTIATLYMISGSPLMYAGTLPVDDITLGYLTNDLALEMNTFGRFAKVVKYFGDCRCGDKSQEMPPEPECAKSKRNSEREKRIEEIEVGKLGPGCSLIYNISIKLRPCTQVWVSHLPAVSSRVGRAGVAVINMGEQFTTWTLWLDELGLGEVHQPMMTNVWTGKSETLSVDKKKWNFTLFKHQSLLMLLEYSTKTTKLLI